MTRVWLIRHGASAGKPGSAIGVSDPPLSDDGRRQARDVAASLAACPLVRIISSDRRRALATARIVARPHGIAVEPTPALREIDFGAWEGRPLGDLWLEEPAAARAWEVDFRSTPASFGESVQDLEQRVETFWKSLGRPPRGGEVAVIAHRGSLAVLRALLTGESVADAFAAGLELGAAVALGGG